MAAGADSLDAVELIMAIEEAFDIEIPDEEAEKMTTPADCVPCRQFPAGDYDSGLGRLDPTVSAEG